MRKKFESIKVEERGIKKLDELVKATGLTKSQVIIKYLPSSEEAKKDTLEDHFGVLKKLFPKKGGILEYMRLMILHSEDLPGDLTGQCDELMESRLNDLFHAIMDIKKGIPPKGGTQRENDNKEQLNSNANVAKSNGDTEIIEEEKTSGERYDKDGKRIFNG
ncbi:MAG: hypothetical protein WA977_05940 [Halobacteriota archaeon]